MTPPHPATSRLPIVGANVDDLLQLIGFFVTIMTLLSGLLTFKWPAEDWLNMTMKGVFANMTVLGLIILVASVRNGLS